MQTEQLTNFLDDSEQSKEWLCRFGFQNIARGQANLRAIAGSGMTLDLFGSLVSQLEAELPETSDPDMALNNLERFVEASRSPLALGALFSRDGTAIPLLLRIFSASQYLSDLLITDPEAYDTLRLTANQLLNLKLGLRSGEGLEADSGESLWHAPTVLERELCDEIQNARDARHAMAILRRFKRRETLRIAYGDLIGQHRIVDVTREISYVADAVCQAALQWSRQQLVDKWGTPRDQAGKECGFVVLALGKLGGQELNYSSDIDLIMVYRVEGQTGKGKSNRQFFERLTRDFTKLMNESTGLGAAYRVDLRLRPDGEKGPVCNSLQAMLQYYDLKGRTWERQAFIKARAMAGDLDLGSELLDRLQPWIYGSYLRRSEIESVRALKRQIERRAIVDGQDRTNVKTGHGGIRDIEFAIQFLQLLHGGSMPEVRTGNTLQAIGRLERAGCLTVQESSLLSRNYNWLRKLEHRLQIMFDLQTHTLPAQPDELAKTARRMGYREYFGQSPLEQFEQELAEVTRINRKILDHLLHAAFAPIENGDQPGVQTPLVVDLILVPDPTPELIEQAFQPYRFRDVATAYKNLLELSRETTAFLSPRRCRHFLAAIAPKLLENISQTPDPDSTLVNLSSVSDSLGAKGVLWELFNFNPASLDLYVRLCASSNYLAGILKSNPGMIDELIDSLLRDELPTLGGLESQLEELTHGAEDHDPIIHSFKNTQHLRIGVRDILGRDDIQSTHRALSDVAEICLKTVAQIQFRALLAKHATRHVDHFPAGDSGLVILAMGKLGGREPNYHSDLDVIFIYEPVPSLLDVLPADLSLQFFFGQLAANITRYVSMATRWGRLYELDSRLRPTGKSGSLAVSSEEFARYFQSGQGHLWERQALCKARPIFGESGRQKQVMQLVHNAITITDWEPRMADEILRMRMQMQQNCSSSNLKRGVGGTVDIEFLTQMLQLKYARQFPQVVETGTFDAIRALLEIGALTGKDAQSLVHGYRLLRSVESRLRLLNTTARHDLPDAGLELEKLAYLLNRTSGTELESEVTAVREHNRALFQQVFSKHGGGD